MGASLSASASWRAIRDSRTALWRTAWPWWYSCHAALIFSRLRALYRRTLSCQSSLASSGSFWRERRSIMASSSLSTCSDLPISTLQLLCVFRAPGCSRWSSLPIFAEELLREVKDLTLRLDNAGAAHLFVFARDANNL